MLSKVIFAAASLVLVNFKVSATPLPSFGTGLQHQERDLHHLYPRSDDLYAPPGSYNKNNAVEFIKGIPPSKLDGLPSTQTTLYSADANGNVANNNRKQDTGHRIDMQGLTTGEKDNNLQVQLNHPPGSPPRGTNGKTTVAGVITDGSVSGNKLKKALVHNAMHPAKHNDKDVIPVVKAKDGTAKKGPNGKSLPNKVKGPTKLSKNPNSKSARKAKAKELGYPVPASPEAQAKLAAKIAAKTKKSRSLMSEKRDVYQTGYDI